MDLTDKQWDAIAPFLPEEQLVPRQGRGRPWRDPRDVLNGVLWVLRTGAPWKDMPARYPPYQTCHRRFQQWTDDGTLDQVLRGLAGDKAYDSIPLSVQLLRERNVELIAPDKRTRKHKRQDGRALRRYRRRWKIERVFAWLFSFRRTVTRYEYKARNFSES